MKASQEAQMRDMAIDFRGGLNQLLFAADAPLKCGLGVMRKYFVDSAKHKKDASEIEDGPKNKVGGLIKIGFFPGAKCVSLDLGKNINSSAKLVFFELGVPHIFHPASYIDYFHESFHLVFDLLCENNNNSFSNSIKNISNKVKRERISEIFAFLLVHYFIFGFDSNKFMFHHLCNYSKSIISIGPNDGITVVRFCELMLRFFMIIDAIPNESSKVMPPYSEWDIKSPKRSTKEACNRFEKFICKYSHFFSEYERLWKNSKGEDIMLYCRQQFQIIYPELNVLMPELLEKAAYVYNIIYRNHPQHNINTMNDIQKQIKQSVREGRPIIRCLYPEENSQMGEIKNVFGDKYLEPILLVCKVLYEYIPKIDGYEKEEENITEKKIHLIRNIKDRKIEYRKDNWYNFQVEKGAALMFCPLPKERRKRLLKQIVTIKTFWDISSGLRERRLREMIADIPED